jgi:prevent-host-death family protein
MARKLTATEAKATILALLDDVAAGDEVEITKHGRTVARLVPAAGPHALKGSLVGVAMTASEDEQLFRDRGGLGAFLTPLPLDSHVVHWWSAEPERISRAAATALNEAHELGIAAISWFELAWLAEHERIALTIPVRSWLDQVSARIRTLPLTPAFAATAVSLPSSFAGGRQLSYATAIEHGARLVTKDRRLRAQRHPKPLALW